MGRAAMTAAAVQLKEVQFLLRSSRGRGERLPALLPVPSGAGRTEAANAVGGLGGRRAALTRLGSIAAAPATEWAAEATG